MRPGQNKRMRGRTRKGPNPLSRSYESNGPDVKVRGTAAHVAEKYVQLARDAHSSGDPVSAESYLQHAEHYYRLLMAAQQVQPQNFPQNGFQSRQQEVESDDSEEFDDDFDGGVMDRFTFRAPQQPQNQNSNGQPYYGNGQGDEGAEGMEQPRIDPGRADQPRVDLRQEPRPDQRDNRPDQRDNRNEPRYDNRPPRNDRNDRPHDRNGNRFQGRDRDPNRDREPNRDRDPNRDPNRDRDPNRNERGERRFDEQRQPRPTLVAAPEPVPSALPAFITGGRPALAPEASFESQVPHAVAEQAGEEAFSPRPRRRRRTKAEMAEAAAAGNDEADIPPAAE